MAQYIVLALPPGVAVPPEGQTSHATFVLTTQASANAAAAFAETLIKPAAGQQVWTVDTSLLQSNTATVTYGIT